MFNKKILEINYRCFATNIINKEKKISQFFKLPKHDTPKEVFDSEQHSSLNSFNDNQDFDRRDIAEKIIQKKKIETESKFNKFFENVSSSGETIKISENLIQRLRLKKEFKFNEDFKQKEILNEYGNYDKYFGNFKIFQEKEYNSDDEGRAVWDKKFNELREKYSTPMDKPNLEKLQMKREEELKKDLEKYGNEFDFIDYLRWKESEKNYSELETTNPRTDYVDTEISVKNEIDNAIIKAQVVKLKRVTDADMTPEQMTIPKKIRKKNIKRDVRKEIKQTLSDYSTINAGEHLDNVLNANRKIYGRVSPWVKEEIYKLYLEGWNIKDLSYKYGLLPERVKVIIWMRNLFWKVVYPKIGESGLRKRLEDGKIYAKMYGYIDYGKDLEELAKREQGFMLKQFDRGEMDIKPTKEVDEKVSKVLKNMRVKKQDYVPVDFIGKGPHGYLIKDMIRRRGIGSRRVSETFKSYCHNKDLNPQILPHKVSFKKELGPRMACLGYRF